MEFFGVVRQTNSGTAEQQETTSTTWEGHQTAFCAIYEHTVPSQNACSGGVASMSGRKFWKFC